MSVTETTIQRPTERRAIPGDPTRWLPSWVDNLGMAVWITDSEWKVRYLNEQAERLLDRPASDCLDRACHSVVNGVHPSGEPYCTDYGPVAEMLQGSRKIEPVEFLLTGEDPDDRHWIQVFPITVEAPDDSGPWLVHCAQSIDKRRRVEEYFVKVALRTQSEKPERPSLLERLTPRETEILDLLAEDRTLHAVANALGITYNTVRNHVQNILSKLDVHSTMEAVALYLLSRA